MSIAITRQGFHHAIRKRPFVCLNCQSWLVQPLSISQRRRVSQNHIRRIKVADVEWKGRQHAIEQGEYQSVLEKLEERGYVNQVVGNRDELDKLLTERRVGVYCGVDPTAASLHIGHMVPFMALGWMYIHGYASTFLLGGFTASIGDPTDRLAARPEQAKKDRNLNMLNMFEQLKKLSRSMETYAERRGYHREWAWRRAVLNNNEWWSKVTLKEYMRMLGKNMRIGPMLGRDSVKNRITKGDGMSYAEFSYPLIQGWDWWHLFQKGTQIQIGGADQFGNILAGAEAVKTIMQEDVTFMAQHRENMKGQKSSGDPMGFTVPLLTTSAGEKFGKSAGNAIWLDQQLTSSYDLYQFFLRSADEDVERYLKLFTFLPLQEVRHIMKEHRLDESKRTAQHTLAYEFVELVHGLGQADAAKAQHRLAFSKNLSAADVKAQMTQSRTTPKTTPDGRPLDMHPSLNKYAAPLTVDSSYNVNIKLPRSLVVQQPLSRILWSAGLVASRSEGQRLINSGGVYVGGTLGGKKGTSPVEDGISYVPARDPKWSAIEHLVIDGDLLCLRTGKWKKKFVHIVSDQDYEASGETCPGWKEETETAADPLTKADLAGENFLRIDADKKANRAERIKAALASARSGGFGEVKGARIPRG